MGTRGTHPSGPEITKVGQTVLSAATPHVGKVRISLTPCFSKVCIPIGAASRFNGFSSLGGIPRFFSRCGRSLVL